jgi:hypothetical protein
LRGCAQRAGFTGGQGFGRKKPKGESAFGVEFRQVWATPALAGRERCWACFYKMI